MQYTQAQIDRANAVSLEDFLRTQGETLIKSGREYRWKEHDSLTVRGNKWFRHSQSKGGYPIDFVMEFYGKSFPEAVQLLTGESGEGQSEASTAPPTAFHLPLHNRTADRAIQYLTESRGLNKTLVEAFLLSGDIYEDAKRHNVVFVGRDRSGTPRYAHVRGTADPFRQDIAGSDNEYITRLCGFPLLILDDFGMERGTEYGLEQVYNVVDSRYRSGKPLIVTTNLTLEELQNPEDTAHARIYDRLTEMCCPVCITGENFRKAKAQAKMERLKMLLNRKESL